MASRKEISVTYDDGRVETYQVKPRHILAAEDALKGKAEEHFARLGFLSAWAASETRQPFGDWMRTVDDIDEGPAEDEGADPTAQAPSPGESPDS